LAAGDLRTFDIAEGADGELSDKAQERGLTATS